MGFSFIEIERKNEPVEYRSHWEDVDIVSDQNFSSPKEKIWVYKFIRSDRITSHTYTLSQSFPLIHVTVEPNIL